MSDSSPSIASFEFVMQDPNERFSKETQTMIRKKAMRGRRRLDDVSGSSHKRSPKRPTLDITHQILPLPLSGLEMLVRDRGIDPVNLSALTSVHVGTIASTIFASEPARLSGVLLCHQRSYFSFIPARFGYASALDDAFRCLLTVVHSMVIPDHKPSHETTLNYYGRALNSLQSAINSPRDWYSTEVLCATAVLALFELLNSPNGRLWSQHIAGASRLIRLRGPARFTSEFDKTLLISLSYPICCEALLNNEACCLDNPAWTNIFKASTIPSETFSDRSPLGIDLMILKSKLPGLTKRTNHAVFTQASLQPSDFDTLATDLKLARSSTLTWRRTFNTALIHCRDNNDTLDFGKRYELLGISLIINIVISRLLASVLPNERALLEEEVQGLAVELKGVQGLLGDDHRRAEFFFAQKSKIADAAIETHGLFEEVLGSGKVVEAWRLEVFFGAMGKKVCDGVGCCGG